MLLICYKYYLKQQQDDVITRCVAAEPHHGEEWQIVAKDMKNVGKNNEEKLKLVASVLS